jgi:hypothetical protein
MRAPHEIVSRLAQIENEDMFGFRREVLIFALPYEHAKPFIDDAVTEELWPTYAHLADVDIHNTMTAYLDFARRKALDHRGISASRSVEKLGEWLWLLGNDDEYNAFTAAPYPQYGVPQLDLLYRLIGLEPPNTPEWQRMATGLPCYDGCDAGCAA